MTENKRPPRSRELREHEFQRVYKACIPCARRKVKCQLVEGSKCARCSKKRLDCTFSTKKPWSREPKNTGNESRELFIGDESVQERSQGATRQAETKQGGLPTSMLQKVVSNNNDAMNILYEAALLEGINRVNNEMPTADSTLSIPRSLNETDALRIWNACRFVKMGWFSSHEAITLVDKFFTNMSPLSPVLTDFFASHKNQFYLVTQEPMLCCTILMISSRHHILPGVGGRSRAFFIHQRMWQHCQHLLMRLTLGQEKISKAKTRNIGSIEALLLMSEWFPRHLQFPPETDGWDSDFIMTNLDARDPPLPVEEIPVSDTWKQDVVEPTKRFEHMSWMVLSLALALAHELGAFDPNARMLKPGDLVGFDAEMYLQHLELRRQRLPSLLFVFINALSSRLGCTSPMPSDVGLMTPDPGLLRLDNRGNEWLAFMKSWRELSKLTSSIMQTLFPLMSTSLATGTADAFFSILEQKQSLLANWRQRNLSIAVPGSSFTDILFIEHQHLRVLINSIGMQVVVQRVLSKTTYAESTIDHSFIERARKLNMTAREYGFIEEVIDGCCETLEKIAALGKAGSLYFSPMRLLFRMISFSIFLMKALALGVRTSKLQETLQILNRAIESLQDNNEDDNHMKLRYAALLTTQAARLRRSLMSSIPIIEAPNVESGLLQRPLQTLDLYPPMTQTLSNDHEGFSNLSGFDPEGPLDFDVNDWLSLPFEPSMVPFGSNEGDSWARLDGVDLDLEFLWQLPA
ncbi:uncharacterized protein N7496_007360 [Penicillium cataractarum]|uniref:Zn(2)-C6 fungal-type domain-containing protein n=1 Tax=Penicillium cataractarum TaxID=2100454 RepID=A0A9W9S3B3_9EURO|nr:uncharacterized protein N7496_007360 [Penicillium cataractarum]KAJ5371268.1 hypothetical protein N7496_007360 [Penicillium cataractarum]